MCDLGHMLCSKDGGWGDGVGAAGCMSFISNGKGRHQNSSVVSPDFLQRMTNIGWQGFAA